MSLVPLLRENRHSLILIIWMTIMPLVCSALITVLALKYEVAIREFTSFQWLLYFIAVTITMATALTPTTFIALLSGFFLGWYAVPFMLIAYLSASGLGYFLAKYVDKGHFINSISKLPKVSNFIEAINQTQLSFIILCRISPVLPFAIMNVVLSIMRVDFKTFLWAGFLGMLPRTILFIWIGSTAKLLIEIVSTGENKASQIAFIAFLLLSIFGFYLYFKNLITKKLAHKSGTNL